MQPFSLNVFIERLLTIVNPPGRTAEEFPRSLLLKPALAEFPLNPAAHEYMLHVLAMRAYAQFLVPTVSQADDLVHDALVQAVESYQLRPAPGLLRVWMFLWLKEVYQDHVDSYLIAGHDEEFAMAQRSPGEAIETPRTRIVRALHTLPQHQREMLFLVAVERFSHVEAAAMLDIPVEAISGGMVEARVSLYSALAGRMRADTPVLRLV